MPKMNDKVVCNRRSRKQNAAAKRTMVDDWNRIMVDTYGASVNISAMSVDDLRAREQKEQEAQLAAHAARIAEAAKAFDDIAAVLSEINSIQDKRIKLISRIVSNPATQMKIGTRKILLDMATRIIAKKNKI